MRKIFVSYRREPDQYVAGNLCRDLRREFGEQQVLRDKDSIEGGVPWKQYVLEALDENAILLVLIGRDWVNTRAADGKRRLDAADDPVRLEIADALRDRATIIPLLLENAQMPAARELPQDLTPLAELNALKLRDGDWEADVARIVLRLEKLGTTRVAGPTAVAAPPSVKRSAKAISSLVLAGFVATGFFSDTLERDALVGFVILSLGALALAVFAFFDIRRGRTSGKGLAIGGMVASVLIALASIGLMEEKRPVTAVESPAPAPAVASPPPAAPQVVAASQAPPQASSTKAGPQRVSGRGAEAVLSEFLQPNADHAALSKRLRPTRNDYLAVFEPEFARKAEALYTPAWDSGQLVVAPKPGQTRVELYSATTQDLKAWTPNAAQNFPGGYRKVASKFRDGLTIYSFEFLEPGKTDGMSYTGLVYVNGSWRIFPKPWRVAE
jgi:hypothetical protein